MASLSRCYMRWFLALALREKWSVGSYGDMPLGTVRKEGSGRQVVAAVVLQPHVCFLGTQPSAEQLAAVHREAYCKAIIGNAVGIDVYCEPTHVFPVP